MKKLSLILMLSLLLVSYASSIEVSEVQVDAWKAYILSGEDLPSSPLFAFTREQAEAIASSLEEKELLLEDYTALSTYADELESSLQDEQNKGRWLRRFLYIAGAIVAVETLVIVAR